jgi:MotA/TolQ/ExbB proton channel family
MSLSEWYISGGVEYMNPITLVFIVNLILIGVVIFQLIQKKEVSMKLIEAGKQLGLLSLALGLFGTIAGFFQMFGAIAEMKDTLPLAVIMGGAKVALITTYYGLITFCISLVAYIMLKLNAKVKSK